MKSFAAKEKYRHRGHVRRNLRRGSSREGLVRLSALTLICDVACRDANHLLQTPLPPT
jgi:hypothetical protein